MQVYISNIRQVKVGSQGKWKNKNQYFFKWYVLYELMSMDMFFQEIQSPMQHLMDNYFNDSS